MWERSTIIDVARDAGVSPATVSRVLNGAKPVSAEVSRRVRETVERLGYQPNPAAQGLLRGRSHAVGVVVPDLSNPYFAEVLKGVTAAADEYDRRTLIADTNEDVSQERRVILELARWVDGIVLCSPRMPDAALRATATSVPNLVCINRVLRDPPVAAVVVDFRAGMRSDLQPPARTRSSPGGLPAGAEAGVVGEGTSTCVARRRPPRSGSHAGAVRPEHDRRLPRDGRSPAQRPVGDHRVQRLRGIRRPAAPRGTRRGRTRRHLGHRFRRHPDERYHDAWPHDGRRPKAAARPARLAATARRRREAPGAAVSVTPELVIRASTARPRRRRKIGAKLRAADDAGT